MDWLRKHQFGNYLKIQALTILAALGMLAKIWTDPRTRLDRPVYAQVPPQADRRPAGRPAYLFQFAFKCVMHTHFATMTRQMVRGESRLVNT